MTEARFSSLPEVVDAFSSLSVCVIGEAMLDSYLEGSPRGISQEAPVPIVDVERRADVPGGAANSAANARALGAEVRFVSVVGDDAEGELLRSALAAAGVAVDDVVVAPGRRTLAKHRVVCSSQMLVRFDQGSKEAVDAELEDELCARLADAVATSDAILVSDYGYGVLTERVVRELGRLQSEQPRVLVVDAKDLPSYRDAGVTAVKPNYADALRLVGSRPNGRGRADAFGDGSAILERTGAEIAAVTMDADGAVVFQRGRAPYRTYARPASQTRAAGAGDTFAIAFALALAAGAETPAAADVASAAAALVVARDGTCVCSADALREAVSASEKVLRDAGRLAARVALYREQGRRVVLTNGCFDILHPGHVAYLSRAKELGDVLVVGVNTDEGVRRLKGPERPINPVDDRMALLAGLSCVDHVVPFGEDTPVDLIRRAPPDVFVKGGDYTRDQLPEAQVVEELGGRVEILPYVENQSTTSVIERIRGGAKTPPATRR